MQCKRWRGEDQQKGGREGIERPGAPESAKYVEGRLLWGKSGRKKVKY